ncbi:MAG: hypothetical protein RL072_1736 [Actinomycetota bacterium]|jgi:hypothetical protein
MPAVPPSVEERLASAKAIAEAMVGVPIVLTQQLLQNIGDLRISRDTTVAQRVTQLRTLGEMAVRLGSREIAKRLGGRPK